MKTNHILLVAAVLASALLTFQNCSQVKSVGATGATDSKSSTYAGDSNSGTSTDNPINAASLKLSFDKFRPSSIDASLCISGTVSRNVAETEAEAGNHKGRHCRRRGHRHHHHSAHGRRVASVTPSSISPQQLFQSIAAQFSSEFESPWTVPEVSSSGTVLGEQLFKVGDYNKFELHLNRGCDGQTSMIVQNPNGLFSTDEDILMTFKGDLHVDSHATGVQLDLTNFLPALEKINSNAQLAAALRAGNGTLRVESAP